MSKKAKENEKIKLTQDVFYGSIYGLIEVPKGTILTVKKRLSSDDGVVTKETVTLKSLLGETTCPYTIWDTSYIGMDESN